MPCSNLPSLMNKSLRFVHSSTGVSSSSKVGSPPFTVRIMASDLEALTLFPTTSHSATNHPSTEGHSPTAQHGANALTTRLFFTSFLPYCFFHGHIRTQPLSMMAVFEYEPRKLALKVTAQHISYFYLLFTTMLCHGHICAEPLGMPLVELLSQAQVLDAQVLLRIYNYKSYYRETDPALNKN